MSEAPRLCAFRMSSPDHAAACEVVFGPVEVPTPASGAPVSYRSIFPDTPANRATLDRIEAGTIELNATALLQARRRIAALTNEAKRGAATRPPAAENLAHQGSAFGATAGVRSRREAAAIAEQNEWRARLAAVAAANPLLIQPLFERSAGVAGRDARDEARERAELQDKIDALNSGLGQPKEGR